MVDSRWVLMVTDFGLHQLVNERSGSGSDINKYYERKLDILLTKAKITLHYYKHTYKHPNTNIFACPKSNSASFLAVVPRDEKWYDVLNPPLKLTIVDYLMTRYIVSTKISKAIAIFY